MDRKEKKHDLRDDMYGTPVVLNDGESKDTLGKVPGPDSFDPLVTPDPTKVPDGQTTKE